MMGIFADKMGYESVQQKNIRYCMQTVSDLLQTWTSKISIVCLFNLSKFWDGACFSKAPKTFRTHKAIFS